MSKAKLLLLLTLTTLGWGLFGTRLLYQLQQRTLCIGCVSREEGLQCKDSVHGEHQQIRPWYKTTIN